MADERRAPSSDISVRAVTRIDNKDVVISGGRFERIDERLKRPRIVVWYPAGDKKFDALTGTDPKREWRIHPEDLSRIQKMFPDKIRAVRVRWVVGDEEYRTLFGMSFVSSDSSTAGAVANTNGKRALVVVLTPSPADHESTSRMLGRIVRLAAREAWDIVEVASLFALLTGDASEGSEEGHKEGFWGACGKKVTRSVLTSADPIGPSNDDTILGAARRATIVLAAWGNAMTFGRRQPRPVQKRDERVLALLHEAGHEVVYALAPNGTKGAAGWPPLHPSHAPSSSAILPWSTKTKNLTDEPKTQ